MQHIQAYVERSPVGGGFRCFLVLEERESQWQLLYVPDARGFWVDIHDLSRVKQLPLDKEKMANRIQKNLEDRRPLGYSEAEAIRAIELLREGSPSGRINQTGEDTMEANVSTNPDTKKAPAKKAAKKAAPKKSVAKKAAPKKSAKTAAPKKAAPAKKDRTIKIKAKENPYRGSRGKRFGLLKPGMTESEFVKVVERAGLTQKQATAGLRLFAEDGHITLS